MVWQKEGLPATFDRETVRLMLEQAWNQGLDLGLWAGQTYPVDEWERFISPRNPYAKEA